MTPLPGSIQEKAIAHLRTLPQDAELPTSALAEAIGHPEITCLDFYLSSALEDKTMELRDAGGIKFWSLSASAWWGPFGNDEPDRPATARRKPLTRVRVDPLSNILGNAIAGRAAGPEVIKLKPPAPPAPPPKAKPARKTKGIQRTKEAAPAFPTVKVPTPAPAPGPAPAPVPETMAKTGPAAPRKSVALKNLQQRDDFPEMSLGTEACPNNAERHITRYSKFFETVQIDGPPIKCQAKDLERVRVALRAYLKRTQKPGTYQVRSIRNFAADSTSRLWIQSKEASK